MPKRNTAPSEADQLNDGMVVLHRSCFVEWQPSPLVALGCSTDGSLSVAVRENGDVELYETSTRMHLQRIPGHEDAAPTSVAVVDQGEDAPCRIFTAGLDGNITEVDYEQGRLGTAADSYGGAVWQLALEPPPQHPPATTTTETAPSSSSEAPPPPSTDQNNNIQNSDDDDDDDDDVPVGAPILAAACDDGCVRLFTVEPGISGVSYSRSLPKVDGRTLTIAWHPSGKFLVSSGSNGCIHVWEVSSGREALRITVGETTTTTTKQVENDEVCVWSLLVLNDGTIVSGDSTGSVCFWDGTFGTLLQKFNQHHADVLQLAASPDGNTVFATGVDPRIAVFQKLKTGSKEWTFLSFKRPHTHDVRAMCVAAGKTVAEPVLFTGGNDTLLLAHSVKKFLKEHPKKVTPCPQRPIIEAATAVHPTPSDTDRATASLPWLMSASRNNVDIWRLSRRVSSGGGGGVKPTEGDRVAPQNLPLHLARLVNRSGDMITAAAVSQNGRLLAFSDANQVRCFSLTTTTAADDGDDGERANDFQPGVPRVGATAITLPSDFPPAVYLFFQPEAEVLVAVAVDGTVRLVSLPSAASAVVVVGKEEEDDTPSSPTAQVLHTIRELHDLRYKMWFKRDRARSTARRAVPGVDLAALSPDGKLLAASVRGRVQLVPLTGHRIAAAIPPQTENVPLTALGFTPSGDALIMVTAANQVVAYQVPSGAPAEWTQKNPPEALPKRVLTLPGPVVGIAASPVGPSAVLLFSSEAVCHLDLAAPVPVEPSGKKRRHRKDGPAAVRTATPAGENCRALYCLDPVLHVQKLADGEVVVVEKSWSDVHRGLAAPMYRHRYGT